MEMLSLLVLILYSFVVCEKLSLDWSFDAQTVQSTLQQTNMPNHI